MPTSFPFAPGGLRPAAILFWHARDQIAEKNSSQEIPAGLSSMFLVRLVSGVHVHEKFVFAECGMFVENQIELGATRLRGAGGLGGRVRIVEHLQILISVAIA